MAAGALGSVLVCARSSGAATDADAGAVAEALLVVASVANADREFNPEKLLTACPPGVSITKVPTFVQVVNESLLSPRLALRADACDCLAVVVAASSSSVASVESILRHEVAEHVFELLRDVSRARAAEEGIDRDGRSRPRHTRGFPAGVPPEGGPGRRREDGARGARRVGGVRAPGVQPPARPRRRSSRRGFNQGGVRSRLGSYPGRRRVAPFGGCRG